MSIAVGDIIGYFRDGVSNLGVVSIDENSLPEGSLGSIDHGVEVMKVDKETGMLSIDTAPFDVDVRPMHELLAASGSMAEANNPFWTGFILKGGVLSQLHSTSMAVRGGRGAPLESALVAREQRIRGLFPDSGQADDSGQVGDEENIYSELEAMVADLPASMYRSSVDDVGALPPRGQGMSTDEVIAEMEAMIEPEYVDANYRRSPALSEEERRAMEDHQAAAYFDNFIPRRGSSGGGTRKRKKKRRPSKKKRRTKRR